MSSCRSRAVLLSWVERAGDVASLKFAERTKDGWSAARTLSSGRDWFVNWADVPSVLRMGDGSLYGHWLQKSGPDTYAYDVRLSRSTDDGHTWPTSFTPHADGTKTEHGFASLYQMPGNGLGLIWLDGRAMKGGHGGEHGGGGDMSVRSATFDTAGKQLTESPVDLRVCECCPTTAAVTAEGPIVAYRDRSDAEIRDIDVSRFVAGKWSDPAPVHRDNWQIAACPVNGPALSADGKAVALAWFTAKGDEGHTFIAFTSDSAPSASQSVWTTPALWDGSTQRSSPTAPQWPRGLSLLTARRSSGCACHAGWRARSGDHRRWSLRQPVQRLPAHGAIRQRTDLRLDGAWHPLYGKDRADVYGLGCDHEPVKFDGC